MNELSIRTQEVVIPIDHLSLKGKLFVPDRATGIIIFCSGNLKDPSENKLLSERFTKEGYATLLFNLLTPEEEKEDHKRLDTELFIQRLLLVTNWVKENEASKELNMAYLGSGTGTAYTLAAASMLGHLIKAVVSRGGHPEMASAYLSEVKAPVLMIVGGMDYYVIESNEAAFTLLTSEKEVTVVEDATHNFEEPGKLDEVADLALKWFTKHLK